MHPIAREGLIRGLLVLRCGLSPPARRHARGQIARARQITAAAGADPPPPPSPDVHDTMRANFIAAAASMAYHFEGEDTRRAAPPARRLAALERRLRYIFRERRLLELALTHRSVASPNSSALAWIGDAALHLILTEHLAAAAGATASASSLTALRSRLASREHCARCAEALGLADLVVVGKGILLNTPVGGDGGGGLGAGVLGETFEAVLGAVLVDGGGVEAVRRAYFENFPLDGAAAEPPPAEPSE